MILSQKKTIKQAEFMYKAKPKLPQQFEILERDQIPYAVIVGPEEYDQGVIRIKEQLGKDASENVQGDDKKGVPVPLKDMVSWFQGKFEASK